MPPRVTAVRMVYTVAGPYQHTSMVAGNAHAAAVDRAARCVGRAAGCGAATRRLRPARGLHLPHAHYGEAAPTLALTLALTKHPPTPNPIPNPNPNPHPNPNQAGEAEPALLRAREPVYGYMTGCVEDDPMVNFFEPVNRMTRQAS